MKETNVELEVSTYSRDYKFDDKSTVMYPTLDSALQHVLASDTFAVEINYTLAAMSGKHNYNSTLQMSIPREVKLKILVYEFSFTEDTVSQNYVGQFSWEIENVGKYELPLRAIYNRWGLNNYVIMVVCNGVTCKTERINGLY